jgi:hypothetical protein
MKAKMSVDQIRIGKDPCRANSFSHQGLRYGDGKHCYCIWEIGFSVCPLGPAQNNKEFACSFVASERPLG